jgi:phospholipid transport system substrate-binding protein
MVPVLLIFLQAAPIRADETKSVADETKSVADETKSTADESKSGIDAARASVEQLYAILQDVMQRSEQLTYDERYAELDPVIRQAYDLPFMSAKTLGRHWKDLSEQDRERWVSTFSRLTVSTYADRFDEYSGQVFEVLTIEPSRHETVMVRTRIVPVGEKPVELDYRLRGADGSWRIIDVFMNGTVSELALRRSEYSSVFKRDGFESLLSSLEEKIDSPES